jgi:DNA-binding beta-propeller fold protein YncE
MNNRKRQFIARRKLFYVIFSALILSFLVSSQVSGDSGYRVRTIDLLQQSGFKVNGAGPLLVTCDTNRDRIILVNTNTSSVSIIDGKNHTVTNIPVGSRVPQYVKMEALALDSRSGNVYVIGNKSLHIVFPGKGSAVTVDTGEQYEMVTVYSKNGNAFLVGRDSKYLAMVQLKSGKIKRFPWVDYTESMQNLNQTPPPPLRKVVCDNTLNRVAAVDGYTNTLYLFSADTGKQLKKRKLNIKGGSRWHLAGYNEQTHHLYLVIETVQRKAIEAIKIDLVKGKDTVVQLPGLTEAVGVNYNDRRDEVYIPYDNHPTVHLVEFKPHPEHEAGDRVSEIKIPIYGNDATALDKEKNRLYVSSWGYGEIEVIDLDTRKLIKRIRNTGIIPHMFNIAFNPATGLLYIPVGATAVNGSFGASLDVLDPESEKITRIRTGWAPVAMVELSSGEGMLVFDSEDQAAEVSADGSVRFHSLPCRFINNAIGSRTGTVLVSYGPHQSYWPTVYIWAAKNGILGVDPGTMTFYDRRIPRMAHQMVVDKNGVFWALQNNWGGEKQFLVRLPDDVRHPNLGQQRIELEDRVIRETTQRILEYDPGTHWLYIARLGETNDEPGILQIYDINKEKTILTYPTGLTPTDLVFDDSFVYVANFDSDTIKAVGKKDFSIQTLNTGHKPFKLALLNNTLYCINHNDNTLQAFSNGKTTGTYPLPFPGKPSTLFSSGTELIITGHTAEALYIFTFHPTKKAVRQIHKESYPFGETSVDTDNSSFFIRGQFADGIFELNQVKQDKKDRLWISDYLSGKLFIIE